MNSPDTPTDVALRYVRDEIGGMRTTLAELSTELRAHTAEQGPRIAVLEHRVTATERDLAELQAQRANERARGWGVWLAVLAALLAATTPAILRMIGG